MPLVAMTPELSANRKISRNGMEEINGDLLEADLWIASILAHLLAFFQRGEPVGMYDE